MADDTTELMYLETFLEEATTDVIVESFITKKKIGRVATKNKALIEPGEIRSTNKARFKKTYKIKLQMDSEANLMAAINDIIDATIAYKRRDGTLTEVGVMCNIKLTHSNKAYIKNKIWKQDIFLEVKWSTS